MIEMTTLHECATSKRMLLAAVFILLSANAVAQEKKCYWCGPLAEQVHRSQRAPPCDPFEQQQTVCDEGYKHCAIVATSPPYTESRLCVKFYQDECYSLYCNSTRTWRMVCPCRGNLCNGQNTNREINAFATLNKIVAKANNRNKRDVVKGFFNMINTKPRHNITVINETNSIDTVFNKTNYQQPIEIVLQNTTVINNYSNQYNDEVIIEHGSTDSITKSSNEDVSMIASTAPTTIEDKTAKVTSQLDMEVPKTESLEPTTSTKPTTIQTELSVINNNSVKVSMPPAEALQHNVTPKVNELTTMATIEVSTTENMIVTTESSKEQKNLATRILFNVVPIIFNLALTNI